MRPGSLRTRLLVTILALVTLGWGAQAGLVYVNARAQVRELFDARLALAAKLLAAFTRHETVEHGVANLHFDALIHRYELEVAYQVFAADGRLLAASEGVPELRALAGRTGFHQTALDGEAWRALVYREPDTGNQVVVIDREADRRALLRRTTRAVMLLLLAPLPALALLLWLAVGRGLAPLRRLGQAIAGRDYRTLEPVSLHGVPREVGPLVRELNALFARLREAFTRFQRFTDHAAHELRTPLAGIRIQAEVALGAAEEDTRRHALGRLLEATEVASHLVDQLLLLARVEADEIEIQYTEVDLAEVAAAVARETAPLAEKKGVEIERVAEGPALVSGNDRLLGLLLRNLVDNAIRYTPARGRVTLRAGQAPEGGAYVAVEDTGPGIPAGERGRVFARFYRVHGRPAGGSGLGLSIVRRIAHLHHAQVALEDRTAGPGLSVRVWFNPASPPLRHSRLGYSSLPEDR